MPTTAIFDIGKTNKKFILFDENYREIYREQIYVQEESDEDGFPCENLRFICDWMEQTLLKALKVSKNTIRRVNFSTYGASFVHLNEEGSPATPLYNYLKPIPQELLNDFLLKYGPEEKFASETEAPILGMLNSGLQLYWLKYLRPLYFNKIYQSLHLPQFCSYFFTGKAYSDYTSISCHTGLWNFQEGKYHDWIGKESMLHLFPAIKPLTSNWDIDFQKNKLTFGIGIHDGSATLLSYILSGHRKFILLSTGTWNTAVNPDLLVDKQQKEINPNAIFELRKKFVFPKTERLIIGKEFEHQLEVLCNRFHKKSGYQKNLEWDEELLCDSLADSNKYFIWKYLDNTKTDSIKSDLCLLNSFEKGYYKLMEELVEMQMQAIETVIGISEIKSIIVDGGFAKNRIFLEFLKKRAFKYDIYSSTSTTGPALGAALAVAGGKISPELIVDSLGLLKI